MSVIPGKAFVANVIKYYGRNLHLQHHKLRCPLNDAIMRVLSHELASLKNVVSYTVIIRSSLSLKIIYKNKKAQQLFTSLFTKDT
jgi:hypothetical protein